MVAHEPGAPPVPPLACLPPPSSIHPRYVAASPAGRHHSDTGGGASRGARVAAWWPLRHRERGSRNSQRLRRKRPFDADEPHPRRAPRRSSIRRRRLGRKRTSTWLGRPRVRGESRAERRKRGQRHRTPLRRSSRPGNRRRHGQPPRDGHERSGNPLAQPHHAAPCGPFARKGRREGEWTRSTGHARVPRGVRRRVLPRSDGGILRLQSPFRFRIAREVVRRDRTALSGTGGTRVRAWHGAWPARAPRIYDRPRPGLLRLSPRRRAAAGMLRRRLHVHRELARFARGARHAA